MTRSGAGSVTRRRHPGVPAGVVFCAPEDETGLINLIVRPETPAARREVFLYSNLLRVSGLLQYEDVMPIVAGCIEDGICLPGPVDQ